MLHIRRQMARQRFFVRECGCVFKHSESRSEWRGGGKREGYIVRDFVTHGITNGQELQLPIPSLIAAQTKLPFNASFGLELPALVE